MSNMRGVVMVLSVLCGVVLVGLPIAGWTQVGNSLDVAPSGADAAVESRTFGPAATTSHTLHAFTFVGRDAPDLTNHGTTSAGARYCLFDGCNYVAGVFLPAGALVTAIELEACDVSATFSVGVALLRNPRPMNDRILLANVSTSDFDPVPGCAAFPLDLLTPHTVDNFNNSYFIQVALSGAGDQIQFQAVRVLYRLQVSPAPAIATFGDAPVGHPQHQFIEALVASGIEGRPVLLEASCRASHTPPATTPANAKETARLRV